MPCGYFDHDSIEEKLHEDLDELSAMLCELCKAYENDTTSGTCMPTHIRTWWKEHEKLDAERKTRKKEELEDEIRDMKKELGNLKRKVKTL